MDEREATEIADELLSQKERKNYALASVELLHKRDGNYPRLEKWVVRYLKPAPKGSTIDDANQLIIVEVDPETRRAGRSKGF